MKKLIAFLLAAMMLLSLAACGNTNNGSQSGTNAESSSSVSGEVSSNVSGESSNTEGENNGTTEGTLGETLKQAFLDAIAANPEATTAELAETVVGNPAIQFGPVTMDMEPGFLPGFNVDITGFETCTTFAPMIGSIPFVGYVFSLAEDADVEAFKQTLLDNCNPEWNICTAAEETVVESVDNTVFFLMCPASMEE